MKWKWNDRRLEITGSSSVLNGKGPLYGVVSDKEVEDESAIENGENLPAVPINLEHLLEGVPLGLGLGLGTSGMRDHVNNIATKNQYSLKHEKASFYLVRVLPLQDVVHKINPIPSTETQSDYFLPWQ